MPTIKNPTFQDIVTALLRASPFAIAPRTDNYANCIEASVAGALALGHWKVKARALLCAVAVRDRQNADLGLYIGFTPRQIYDRLVKKEESNPSFEEWLMGMSIGIPDDPEPAHMVIEAEHRDERALIDLTLGQLRRLAPEAHDLPICHAVYGPGWPNFESGTWVGRYFKCPHGSDRIAKLEGIAAKCKATGLPGFVGDLTDTMKLSLNLENDEGAFYDEIQRQQPAQAQYVADRLRALSIPR